MAKNLAKNKNEILGFKWPELKKNFYQCLDEYDEDEFLEKWNQLKIKYLLASKYLEKMNRNIT